MISIAIGIRILMKMAERYSIPDIPLAAISSLLLDLGIITSSNR